MAPAIHELTFGPSSGGEMGARAATSGTEGGGGGTAKNGATKGSLTAGANDFSTIGSSSVGCGIVGRTASISLPQSWRTGALVIAGSPSRLRANSAASSSVIAKLFFSMDGAHPAFGVCSEPIPEKAASRQSICPAGISLAVSSIAELMCQLPVFDDSSGSSSSSALAKLLQSRSGAICVWGEIANTASSSGVAVSSRLPNASGCELVAIVNGEGRGTENTGVPKSSSRSCTNTGVAGVILVAGCGCVFVATGMGGGAVDVVVEAGVPNATPARARAAFTIEIKGSGGTNGFLSTPSAPTREASCSSRGSNAPTSKITGICDSAELSLTNLQTSYPLRTGIKISAKTKSGFTSAILRTAASPFPTATT